MKNRQILFIIFCAVSFFPLSAQSVKTQAEYKKIYIGVHAGLDYSLGTSNTVVVSQSNTSSDFYIPFVSKGFNANLDGVYFFTKNYGIGLKYRFFTAKEKTQSEYIDDTNLPDYLILKSTTVRYKEETHLFGPAIYAKWSLFGTKWNITTNVGAVYLHNKLSNLRKRSISMYGSLSSSILSALPLDENKYERVGDLSGATVGFTFSAGIRYQITPTIGIGVYGNGLFASLSSMKMDNSFSKGTIDVSRKINRIGFSAGIDYNF